MWDVYALLRVKDLIKAGMTQGICFYSVYGESDLKEIEYEIERRKLTHDRYLL